MDFKIDTEELMNLYTRLYKAAGYIETNVKQIYEGIDAMHEGWEGPSYDAFKEKALSYKVYLDSMVDTYRTWWALVSRQIIQEHFVNLRDELSAAYDILAGGSGEEWC